MGSERIVIAGRVLLLSLAAGATVWAFAFSGSAAHTATASAAHAHGHGAAAPPLDMCIAGEEGREQHDEHQHHAAAHQAPATPHDPKVIGAAERRVFTLETRAPAWVDGDGAVVAVLRKDELGGLSSGERAEFFRAASPAEGIAVRLAAAAPESWDEATARVRFRGEARASGLRPYDVGWIKLAARSRELLVIPAGAVLYSPAGPYVLALDADGRTLGRRRVEIGSVSRGLAVVLAGLRDGEPIAIGSTFSLDAERRVQPRHEEIAGVTR